MKRDDIHWAFGRADASFEENVRRTLAKLRREEERPVKKIKWGIIAAVAACLAFCGIAYAAAQSFGLLDYLRGRFDEPKQALPGAEEIVDRSFAQQSLEGEWASFAVREVVYDGQYIYMTVEAKPKDAQTLLVLPDSELSDRASDLGPTFSGDVSIAQYAERNGIERVLRVNFADRGPDGALNSTDCVLDERGVMTCYLSGPCQTYRREYPMQLLCMLTQILPDDRQQSSATLPLTLRVEAENGSSGTDAPNTVVSAQGADYPDCGVRVDKVTLYGTPMAIYATVEFTVTDQAKYMQSEAYFEFVDEAGNPLTQGAPMEGGVYPGAPDGDHCVFKTTLQAGELPRDVYLRACHIREGELSYGTHAIAVSKP